MDKWQELTIEVNREVEEAASNILIESGSQGVAIDDSADYLENADRFGELYPEVEQVETVKITAYYPESADIEAITKQGAGPERTMPATSSSPCCWTTTPRSVPPALPRWVILATRARIRFLCIIWAWKRMSGWQRPSRTLWVSCMAAAEASGTKTKTGAAL